jgi:hypothetical protein
MRKDKKAQALCKKLNEAERNENLTFYIVSDYEREVLNTISPRCKETGEFIMESKRLYLASEEVAEACYKAFNEARKAKTTLKVKDEGYCPLLVAESETIKAKQEFINYTSKYTGLEWNSLLCSGVSNCNKMVDITQKLFANPAI